MHRSNIGLALLTGFALGAPARAVDPSHIVFYNKFHGGEFGVGAFYYAMQEMGLLDANGLFGEVQDNGEIKVGGNVVGSLIMDGNFHLGYKNADGSKEAYEISQKDMDFYGFKRVANNGRITFYGHGLVRKKEVDGQKKTLNGGAFQFGRFWHTGFKPQGAATGGTGVGVIGGSTVSVTALGNRTVALDMFACFSANDPDGAGMGNPERSVTASAGDVPGINPIRGFGDVARLGASLSIVGGTAEERAHAYAKVERLRRGLGFCYTREQAIAEGNGDLTDNERNWVAFCRYWTISGIGGQKDLAEVIKTGDARIKAEYVADAYPRGVPSDPYQWTEPAVYTPITLIEPMTQNSVTLSHNQSPRGSAMVTVGPGDLFEPLTLRIEQLVIEDLVAPVGLPYLATGIFDFRSSSEASPVTLAGALDYSFELIPDVEGQAELFFLTDFGWEPVPSTIDDGRILASDARVGIYAAFSAIPAPGSAGVIALAALTTLRRRRITATA